jgi:hypothetical protein
VLVISGAGFNSRGVAAFSVLLFDEITKITMKKTMTAAIAIEMIGAMRRGACSDIFHFIGLSHCDIG